MLTPNSDLILEAEAASPLHAKEPTAREAYGYTVLSSSVLSVSYSTVITGLPPSCREAENDRFVRLTNVLTEEIRRFLPILGVRTCSRLLVVGIGNATFSSDALGSRTAEKLAVDPKGLFAFCPSVEAKTALSSVSLVRAVAEHIHPDFILAVDSLAARYEERLGSVIQLSSGGITPSSGISGTGEALSGETMPCPVLALGVPTVIRASAIAKEISSDMLVTPAKIDRIIEWYSAAIAAAVGNVYYEKAPPPS